MKLLLVVGLAAVVIVILIAVFLSVRLGRGDDHEEPVRPGSRDRRRRDEDDPRWQDADARDSRLVMAASRSGGSGSRAHDEDASSHYRDRGERRPAREQAARGPERDYDYPDHRDTGPSEHPSSPRRATARNGRPANDREYRDRPAGGRRDQRDSGPLDYPDYPSGPQRAYAGRDYPSGPLPVPDVHSGEYPSADHPSMDFPSGPLPAADHPAASAGTQPGSRRRSKSGPGKNGSGREQPESRRKPAKSQSGGKGRSRSRRDDDDWPSTEWDKLTDEQYWAEVSSDKPLSTSARAAQPASEPTPAAGNGRSRPANGKQAASHGTAAPMPPAEPARELPSRKAPSPLREPVTERLPVRARPQPPVPARSANGSRATRRAEATLPRPAEEPSLAVLSSLATSAPARPYGALDEDPLTSPSFSRPALDSRSYQRPGAPPARSGAHRQPAASYDLAGYGTAGYRADGYPPGPGYPGPDYPARDYSGPLSAPPASGYQFPGQAGPGYAYPDAQPPQAPPASWQRPLDEQAPAQGNPYGSYVDPAPASYQASPAVYPDSHPSGGHAYPADPAGSYDGPGFSQAPAPYQPAIAAAGHAADAGHYPVAGVYPPAGYPSDGGYGYEQHASQAVYPAPQEAVSYPPGYANGYPADPYENNGYGYPAAQG
jgi:hypothetical protein